MLYRYSTDKHGRPVKKAVVYTKGEHTIPRERVDQNALWIVERLKNCGFEAYIVGGAVRDLIVGKSPKDFDIVTDATPSKIKRLFRNSRIIGKRFRLVHIFFGEKIFEVATFRSIRSGSVGNDFGTMDEDVLRRDFSINALYYDPVKEQVVDYVGGFEDIRNRVLSPVIPLDRIFEEDPVRMIRAVKYSTTVGCRMPHAIRHRIKKSARFIKDKNVSASRLTEELLKIVNSGHARDIVAAALELDLYAYLQPAASAMMFERKEFAESYMRHLAELDSLVSESPDARLGRKLAFMVGDFILSLTDWRKEVDERAAVGELYTRVWGQVRSFVLPMNPPRAELEYAIKETLAGLGVPVKFPKRRGRRQ